MIISPSRLWAPALVVASLLTLAGCTATPEAPNAESAPSATPTPSASPSPTTSMTPDAPAPAGSETVAFTSCDDMITTEWKDAVAQNGWVGWNTVDRQVGIRPLNGFPGGAPEGQLACRFGVGPDVGTDNVLDLVWAPITTDAANAAQEYLQSQGFERIDVADGVQWSVRAMDGWGDAEGWGQTYLFTASDVRWVQIRDHLSYIKSAI